MAIQGTYKEIIKNGSALYRSSVTYKSRHISLGSYKTQAMASIAYNIAADILFNKKPHFYEVHDYSKEFEPLYFEKWVMLLNLKNNGIYARNPIYLEKSYFYYFLSRERALKFDADDLFFYKEHKITVRGGHMFTADYGNQINILSRYGIPPFAVSGRDYVFANGDENDFTYANIKLINRYTGVKKADRKGKACYIARIHINGNFIVGFYDTEEEAAAAYNKAADILNSKGILTEYNRNYIDKLSTEEYRKLYLSVKISAGIIKYTGVPCKSSDKIKITE